MQKIASYLEDVRDPEVKRLHRFGSFGKIWKYKKVLYDGIFSLNLHEDDDDNERDRGAPNSCLIDCDNIIQNSGRIKRAKP